MPNSPMKLKHVLILPFLLLISLAVLVTSFWTYKYSEKATEDLGNEISKQSAQRMQERLDYYLSKAKVSNQLLKQVIDYNLVDINNQPQVLEYIHYTMLQNPEFGTLSFAYPDGSYMGISYTINGRLLEKKSSPNTGGLFFTYELPLNKLQPKRLVQIKPEYNANERPWFTQAKASNTPIWSSVFEMFSNDELGLTYAEAIHNKDDQLMGVIGTDVVFYDLNEKLHKIRLTPNSYLFILDAENKVIAQSDTTETHLGTGLLHSVDKSHNSLLKKAVKYIDENKSSNMNENGELDGFYGASSFEVDGSKQDYFVNFIPYGHKEGLKWNLGIIIPKNDFLGDISAKRTTTFKIWFISFILSIILGLAITYLINRAIKRLHYKLEETEASGSMYYHDGSHRIQEVSDLSERFSLMSKRLYESYVDLQITNKDLEKIVAQRTEALKKANTELLKESHVDELTNLANRRSFNHFLDFYWNNLKTKQVESLSLLICDLDCLKVYNKTYGRTKGDEFLKLFAKILEESVNELDIVARTGGEEFIVILPNTSEEQASEVAETIMKKLSEASVEHKQSCTSDCMTTSIGIVSIIETNTNSPNDFLACADNALDLAKKSGRNQYAIYQNK